MEEGEHWGAEYGGDVEGWERERGGFGGRGGCIGEVD